MDLDAIGNWTLVSTEGGRDRWEIAFRGTSDLTAVEVMDHIGRNLTTKGKWTSITAAATRYSSTRTSQWKFTGRDGKPWTGTLEIQASPAEGHQYTGKLTIARAG